MSLYNMLHGYEPTMPFVLQALLSEPKNTTGLTPKDLPRFRDAYVTYDHRDKTKAIMVMLTRTGGVNRVAFIPENEAIRNLPGYIDDVDDTFDSTFALFRYELPEAHQADVLQYLREHGVPLTLREKTMQATSLADQTRRQKIASEQIMDALAEKIFATRKSE